MIKTREFHIFSVYRAAGFDQAAIAELEPALRETDFSEAADGVSLTAFVEVTLQSQARIDFVAAMLREHCARNALGFAEERSKLVAVFSLGRLISRPAGEAVTRVIETARALHRE